MPYRSIEDPVKLRRVVQAILLLEGDLELPVLLRHVIEEALSMTGARYGALGVLNEQRTGLDQFISVGLDPEEETRIGDRPTGRGVLGLLITDTQPVRLTDLGSHSDSFGFPPNHPPMTSFLGVPIRVRDEVYGNLYLTDKVGGPEFTSDDESLVGALALAAGIAIANTRLHQRLQKVAVYEDRDRLARDLHDTVIQRLFAVGLSLQAMAGAVAAEGLQERFNRAISDLDDTIRQVRSTIYELGMTGEEQGIRARIQSLVRDLEAVLKFKINVSFDGPVDSAVPDEIAEHLLNAIREGATNIERHAHATRASVTLKTHDGMCTLEIADNGGGLQRSGTDESGFGLANLQHRAEKLHGKFAVENGEEGGTLLTWQVPLP
jgi:signal transduction histidine kinase